MDAPSELKSFYWVSDIHVCSYWSRYLRACPLHDRYRFRKYLGSSFRSMLQVTAQDWLDLLSELLSIAPSRDSEIHQFQVDFKRANNRWLQWKESLLSFSSLILLKTFFHWEWVMVALIWDRTGKLAQTYHRRNNSECTEIIHIGYVQPQKILSQCFVILMYLRKIGVIVPVMTPLFLAYCHVRGRFGEFNNSQHFFSTTSWNYWQYWHSEMGYFIYLLFSISSLLSSFVWYCIIWLT